MALGAIVAAVSLLATSQADGAPALSGTVRLREALPIDIEIAEPVGSNISHIDDTFEIRTAVPVTVEGRIVLPAGIVGRGQVVHAAKSTGLGKAGELILAARFVECGALHVPLRGMRFAVSGKDKSVETLALSSIAIPFAFLSGGKVLVPAGTRAIAKLATALELSVAGCEAPAALAADPSSPEGKLK